MKTSFFNRAVAVVVALLFASQVFAASDFLLQIEGVKGEGKGKTFQLTEQADGSFTVENIPGGTYKLVYKPVQTSEGSNARTVSEGHHIKHIKLECIVSPRDAASGLPTGKRQHKPVTFTKEWDKSTPQLLVGQIVVGDLDGDGASDRKPGDPIPGLDVKAKSTSAGAPVKAGYDLKVNKKV